MNTTDYWPFVRQYSIWNATVSTLQFGQLILNLRGSVVPLNKSMLLSFTLPPHTCYTSNLKKFYSVTSRPCLIQPLRANSPWKMKDMRVEVKISTYSLLSDELPESTMFLVMKTSPSTLLPHTPQLPASHIASLCTTRYYQVHSVALMMKKVPQFTFHLITTPYHHRTPWVLHNIHCPSPSTLHVMTQQKKKRKIFKLDDHHWITDPILDRHLSIHEHFNHTVCALIHVHATQIPLPHHTRTHWISVTFLTSKM